METLPLVGRMLSSPQLAQLIITSSEHLYVTRSNGRSAMSRRRLPPIIVSSGS